MNLFANLLPPVQLRFNNISKFSTDTNPRNGIKRFGPYDASLFMQSQIRCGIIYPASIKSCRDLLVNGLVKGEGSNFPGFSPWFKARLIFDPTLEKPVSEDPRSIRQAVSELATRNCDLVYIVITARNGNVYQVCKSTLLCNGIPCQVVTAPKLQNSFNRPWVLGNIALASYAKIGGTPWVAADSAVRNELVMGVSRAQDKNKKYVVGFVTLFNQDGDFLLMHSKTPVIEWEDYVKGIEDLIVDAYHEYKGNFGVPKSLIIHFHKKPGYSEINAINNSLKQLGESIPYALMHLNEYSLFRLFDTSHPTYVPVSGIQVNLSRYRALLLLDGRENDKRNRVGVPNVWEISMDKRSTMSWEDLPRLVQQIHKFSRVNWRGFNSRSIPVTINYSKLICDQVLDIGLQSWNTIIANGKLKEKAWFL